MGEKLSPDDNELYKIIDEVLHYIWDPIGVAGSPYARDEYGTYLPQVLKKIKNNETKDSIVSYLLSIEEYMGLSPNKEKAETIVKILFEHKDKIDEAKF